MKKGKKKKRTVALERRDDVERLARLGGSGLDGPPVNHQGGPVEARGGDDGAGHVLVASGEGDVGVVPFFFFF